MPNIKKRRRLLGLLSLLLAFASLLALPAGAQTTRAYTEKATKYPAIPIYIAESERLLGNGRLQNDTTIFPLRAFYAAFLPEAKLTYSAATRTAEIKTEGFTIAARDGSHILYANGRCLFSETPIQILSDGTMYAPLRSLAKTLSLSVKWNASTRSVTLSGKPTPLEDGATYYDAEDLYWLSRIISAESRGEPLIGQIAVGNVVLNRASHKAYPDTVKGVIFDRQGGVVQFSPVADGSIWKDPYATSVSAAKICLEGYTVSDRILFFYAPSMVSSTWIERNRPYAFTIASHRFFY